MTTTQNEVKVIVKDLVGENKKLEQIILDCFNEGREKCQSKK